MESTKIDLKVYAGGANGSEAPPVLEDQKLIPIFHRWIQQHELDELMIDVADYSHVPDGPSILLICHDAHYVLDRSGGEVGLLYSRRRETASRASADTTLSERLQSVFEAALEACVKLENEDSIAGMLRFPCNRFLLRINDRLVGAEAAGDIERAVHELLERSVPDCLGEVEIVVDETDRLSLSITTARAPGSRELLERLVAAREGTP